MREPTPLWCKVDGPHSEHEQRNQFGGWDYCSGRPEPIVQRPLPVGFRLIVSDLNARGGHVSAEILSDFIAKVDSGEIVITYKEKK